MGISRFLIKNNNEDCPLCLFYFDLLNLFIKFALQKNALQMPYNGGFLQFVTKSTLFNNKLKSKCYEKKSTFNVNAWCSNVVCMLYTKRW